VNIARRHIGRSKIRYRLRFAAVLPVEALYKSAWLASVLRTLLKGERPEVVPLAVLCTVWVAAGLIATLYAHLFGED
jgi:hypothetical protein